MSINIPLKKGQMNFSTPSSTIQLALKLESSDYIPQLMDFFTKSLACLHLRLKDENNLVYTKDKVYHYSIPSELTDLGEVCDYIGTHFTPSYEESFGSIATSDKNKLFVVNVSHRFCDGGFFKFLLDKFNNHEYPSEIPIIPRFASDIFKDEIQKAPSMAAPINDRSIFRFRPNKLASPIKPATYQAHYDIKMKANEFKTYDQSKNTPRSITDVMFLALYFASSCYKNSLFEKLSVQTVIDLRTLLPYKADFLSCYHCGHLYPTISGISPDDKLKTVSQKLKDDLNLRRKENRHFSLMKATPDANDVAYGIGLCYSAVGVMDIKRPIVDAYAGITMRCSQPKSVSQTFDILSLFNWSVRDSEQNKNDFTTQLWYNKNVMDQSEVNLLEKRVRYFLKNVSLDEKVGDVYETLKKIK